MRCKIFLALLTFWICFFTTSSFAKSINLYADPKDNAKVMATIDPSKGIVPIFTPPSGEWIKVGDPQNGNVGWIKSKELAQSDYLSGFTFSQKIIGPEKGPHSYVFQFGVPAPLTSEQSKTLEKQIQTQQAAIQQAAQKIIQDLFTSFNAINFPVIVPVIVQPALTPAEKPKATKNKPST